MGRPKRIDTWHGRRGEQDDCWIRAGEGILLASVSTSIRAHLLESFRITIGPVGMLSRQTSFTIFCLLLRSLECIHHESWPNLGAVQWKRAHGLVEITVQFADRSLNVTAAQRYSVIIRLFYPFLTLLVVFWFSYVPYIYLYIILYLSNYLYMCINIYVQVHTNRYCMLLTVWFLSLHRTS